MLRFRQSKLYRRLTDDNLTPDSSVLDWDWRLEGIAPRTIWTLVAAAVLSLLAGGFLLPVEHSSLRQVAFLCQAALLVAVAAVPTVAGERYIRRRWGVNPPLGVVALVMLMLAPPSMLLAAIGAIRFLPLFLDELGSAAIWVALAFGAFIPLGSIAEAAWRQKVIADLKRQVAAQQVRTTSAVAGQRLAEVQLRSLQAQIEPHFLWNTLANVQQLMRQDVEGADGMLDRLLVYLRAALPGMRSTWSTLGQEFALSTAYLDILTYRYGGRLSVTNELPPDLAAARFPPLILQTLVENAIKHGVEPKVGPVSVKLRAWSEGNGFVVSVEDDGAGFNVTNVIGEGLRNIRERLHTLYAGAAQFELAPNEPSGVVASIYVPEETVPAAGALVANGASTMPRPIATPVATNLERPPNQRKSPAVTWRTRWRESELYRYLADEPLTADSDLLRPQVRKAPSIWLFEALCLLLLAVPAYLVPTDIPSVRELAIVAQACLCLVAATPMVAGAELYVRRRWGANPSLAVVGAVMLLIAPMNAFVMLLVMPLFPLLRTALGKEAFFVLGLFTGLALPLGTFAYLLWRSSVQKALRARLVEATARADDAVSANRVAELELHSLQAQLEPNFLYQTLAAVGQHMRPQPDTADALLTALIRYLRAALPKIREENSTLAREFAFSGAYLHIMSLCSEGQLTAAVEFDPALAALPFPQLVLQTLVESAVPQGQVVQSSAAQVALSARTADDQVVVTLSDSRLSANRPANDSALQVVRDLLAKAYGTSATLEVQPASSGGVDVTVRVPRQSPP